MMSELLLFAAETSGSTLVKTETALVIMFTIAAGVAVLSRAFGFPNTVALVLAGFAASALGEIVAIEVSPELIMALLVPPLLFEATLHLPWRKLRADLFPVMTFALLGTAFGTLSIGWLVHATVDVPWAAAFAFGALISATDPVAVIAFFKSLGAPKRLSVLVEGESLFNDAVAVVAFNLAIAAGTGGGFTLAGAAEDFLVVSLGGLGVGLALGYVVSEVILARVDDPLIETTTTLALAYGAYLIAEDAGHILGIEGVHFSGLLAVVAAGLMVGNLGLKNTSPSTRVTLDHFWELLTFLVNSFVFLLIGLTISLTDLAKHLDLVAIAVLGILVIRAVIVYGLTKVSNMSGMARPISMSYQHVMYWGGLRGAISLALALSLDVFDTEIAEKLKIMTFGAVLFTLLIQGLSMSTLITKLGLAGRADNELEQQTHQAKIAMRRAGQAEVARLGADGVLFAEMADALGKTYQRDVTEESAGLRKHFSKHPELEVAMLLQARRDALLAESSGLSDIVRSGMVEQQVADDLAIELNNRLAALELIEDRWEQDDIPDFDPGGDNAH